MILNDQPKQKQNIIIMCFRENACFPQVPPPVPLFWSPHTLVNVLVSSLDLSWSFCGGDDW